MTYILQSVGRFKEGLQGFYTAYNAVIQSVDSQVFFSPSIREDDEILLST